VTLTLNRPWSNIGTAHRLIILDICAKLFVNTTRGSKDIERTINTVMQCLILVCDLDLEPTLIKHRHYTLCHHTWHLCKVICKNHQGFKRYRADTKYSHTMFNLRLWPWSWTDLDRTRDETIRSSHDTIRIDTKGDNMVIFDTIRIIFVKIQTFTLFISFYLWTQQRNASSSQFYKHIDKVHKGIR